MNFRGMEIERTKEMVDGEVKNWVEEDYWMKGKDGLEEWRNWKSDRYKGRRLNVRDRKDLSVLEAWFSQRWNEFR